MLAMEHFGTRLKRFRDARSWSQEQLGFELDVTKATISKWEAGQAQPRWENLAHLRRVVAEDGLTLDWLIDGVATEAATARSVREPSPQMADGTDEMALLARFRALKPSRRKGLLALLAE
jgi:transcriptional regulator with XRE-family HTH domain